MEDDLSAAAVSEGLVTRFVGQRVLYHRRLTTTMDAAREEAVAGAPEGTVVIAEEQTEARGRLKRAWVSPQGNLALSIVLYPGREYLRSLTMVASVAVVRAIEDVAGLRPEIKWPNDILLDGKKVCGILIEAGAREGRTGYAVVGIGVNVNMDVAAFPEIAGIATSLSGELGRELSRVDLLRSLLSEAEFFYLAASAGNAVYDQWRRRLVTLGKRVRAMSPTGDTSIEGLAETVDRDGGLVLRLDDGSLIRVLAGDVTLSDQP